MKKKAAIQLSVNFIVVLILCIVLFGLGIMLFYKVIYQGKEFKHSIDERTEERIYDVLDSGQAVLVWEDTKTVKRGEGTAFALGLRNVLGDTHNFRLRVDNPSGFPISYSQEDQMLENFGKTTFLLAVNVPDTMRRDQHSLDVQFEYQNGSWKPYDKLQRIYVIVP